MSGFVDLHCHYLPGVDDGVRSLDESVALLEGLARLGFERVVATPHIRTSMFENDADDLRLRFEALDASLSTLPNLPDRALGAEHFFDDVLWARIERGEFLPHPGGSAVLIELHPQLIPLGLEQRLFELKLKGMAPLLAHPERYRPFFRSSEGLRKLMTVGAMPVLDLMSLVGRYGDAPQVAAERILDEGLYRAACSDSHGPSDLPRVEAAIERLRRLVGAAEAENLLSSGPRSILAGALD